MVRVYNVGFGDCFLLLIPDAPAGSDRPRRVLIDCGSITYGDTGLDTERLVQRIIADVTDDDGVARLDVVIATHRHRDHILGFGRPEWAAVHLGEVWLPWCESPDDPLGLRLTRAQERLATALTSSVAALGADKRIGDDQREMVDVMGLNALTNAESMETLRFGFAGKPRRRYLERSSTPVDSPVVGDAVVRVLGPSRDLEVIKAMNPPSDQTYLAALGLDATGGVPAAGGVLDDDPFPRVAPLDWQAYSSPVWNRGVARTVPSGDVKGRLRLVLGEQVVQAASGLDSSLNNTSLMLSFEIGDHYLLFPGDAQWGPWRQSLAEQWSAALLHRTTFLKIGHHGSHNATPVELVEALPGGAWAVASVAPYSRWKEIPKAELLDKLEERSPRRVHTTMHPPASSEVVTVLDDGLVLEYRLG